ncbi:hypothetical protein GQX73_g3591 [Xylaria multiplex]|uniref:Uncharacterized protein n=1 Tax=Xylaria multiplex TaxID=323545 RepID=A0A7C8IZ71_9PEZI|nr:hypothetical protein GQX73_g3591 [Xylaria multiplex]
MAPSSESGSRISTATTLLSNRSFLGKYLTRTDASNTAKNEQETPKGPLGLTTVFEPEGQVVADLIFVHGLNGGSRSTWSKSDDSFWPQAWLPRDDAFHDVRIHTFGYPSGLSRDSVLNIRDFAGNLLACVQHCPALTSSAPGPIIFVGHSMGGLVIKKAYILARQMLEYNELADRIHALFFLATPHQGAGIAQLLTRFLGLAGPRPFVNDLHPQSLMLQVINEEFPRYSQSLQLFSFYETQSMYYGVGKGLIVEKHCAVMNYTNERRTYLDANHRDVARFSTSRDPSYILVRNALATTINSQRGLVKPEKKGLQHVELEAMSKFLGVSGAPEDDLITHDSRRLAGSCQWLVQKDSFQQWYNALTSKFFWLQGRPGAGKTMLASHVVNHLHESGLDCSYFFFKQGDEGRDTINALLRSMAWQMIVMHPEAFITISNVTNSWTEPPIDKVDHILVWRRIFAAVLLKIKLKRPQYWVIDALDECKNSSELMFFLGKAQEIWPLCILATSRTGVETYLSTANPSMEVITENIREENKVDIASFLKANLHNLPGATTDAQQDISDRILQNSRGCFLWVSLVLNELRQVHTTAEINQVLDNNHSDMYALYSRSLDEMSRAKFGKDLARAILRWVTCTFRPLSVGEIHSAIEADIRDSVGDIEKSISTCSNLVFVDTAKKVQLIHLTAREFLTRKDINSEFIIDISAAHKRLALICVQTLCEGQGNLAKGSRARSLSSDIARNTDSALYDYASAYLFQHLIQVEATDDEIFIELAKFFSSREVLVWIEHLAKQADLQRLYQAGKNCTILVARRKQQTPALDIQKQLILVERWGIDLVRLVNKFGKRLNQSPTSIHYAIPPFCPTNSAFRTQFVNPYRGLNLQGRVSKDWDDCLCTIYYPRLSSPKDITASANRTAIALSNGTVVIYDNTTLLQTNNLKHEEPVWSISFSENGRLFATGGAKTIRIWDLNSSKQVISFRVPALCMSIAFIQDDEMLLVVSRNNSIIYWDITKNVPRGEPIDWTKDLLDGDPQLHARVPTIAAFSREQNLLAIVYKGYDILLWTLDGEEIYDLYEKDNGSYRYERSELAPGSTTVWAVAFSSSLETNFLVAAYSDGDVVVFDTDSGECRGTLEQVNAQTVACSPDGRTLATADSQGNVDLFDLRTLKFLYRLRFDTDVLGIKKITFAADGLRLLSIRNRQFGVWDPTVLLRREFEDEVNDSIPHPTTAQNSGYDSKEVIDITAMVCLRDVPEVVCGKDDGTVHIYNISSEPHSQELFTQTRNCAVTLLQLDDDGYTLTCADISGRVTSRALVQTSQGGFTSGEVIFDKTGQYSISQTILSIKHNRILISTVLSDVLWSLEDANSTEYIACIEHSVEGGHKTRWFTSPRNEDILIRFEKGIAVFYQWESLIPIRSVELVSHGNLPLSVDSVIPSRHSQYFATVKSPESSRLSSTREYHVWDFEDFVSKADLSLIPREKTDKMQPILEFEQLGTKVDTIVGFTDQRAIFLDADNWVCSTDILSSRPALNTAAITPPPGAGKVVRHFFIPDDWISPLGRALVEVRRSGEIVFVRRTDLTVIRRGLGITETGGPSSRRVTSTRSVPRRLVDRRRVAV